MRRCLLAVFWCLAIAGQLHATRINPKRAYPRFQIGVTGAIATG